MFHHTFTPINHYYSMIYIKFVNVKDIFKQHIIRWFGRVVYNGIRKRQCLGCKNKHTKRGQEYLLSTRK